MGSEEEKASQIQLRTAHSVWYQISELPLGCGYTFYTSVKQPAQPTIYGLHAAHIFPMNPSPNKIINLVKTLYFCNVFGSWISQTSGLRFINDNVAVPHKRNLCMLSLSVHTCSFGLTMMCGFQCFLPKAESSRIDSIVCQVQLDKQNTITGKASEDHGK